MSSKEIAEEFPDNPMIRQVMDGKKPMPTDPAKRAIYRVQIARLEEKKEKKEEKQESKKDGMPISAGEPAPVSTTVAMSNSASPAAEGSAKTAEELAAAAAASGDASGNAPNNLADPKQKEALRAMNNPQNVVADELAQAKLLRAIYSDRQLEEVMSDFWFNHFNVFANKGADRILITNYEQDVIRPHALGKFEDLLVATAKR